MDCALFFISSFYKCLLILSFIHYLIPFHLQQINEERVACCKLLHAIHAISKESLKIEGAIEVLKAHYDSNAKALKNIDKEREEIREVMKKEELEFQTHIDGNKQILDKEVRYVT